MFCRHKWETLSETVTESKFENSVKVVRENCKNVGNIPGQMVCADRKHIQIITCNKCGKLKRFVENI